jgi:hypothetical protein
MKHVAERWETAVAWLSFHAGAIAQGDFEGGNQPHLRRLPRRRWQGGKRGEYRIAGQRALEVTAIASQRRQPNIPWCLTGRTRTAEGHQAISFWPRSSCRPSHHVQGGEDSADRLLAMEKIIPRAEGSVDW